MLVRDYCDPRMAPCRGSPGPTLRDACGCMRGSAGPGGGVPGTDQVSVTPMPAAKEICPPMLLIWTITPRPGGVRGSVAVPLSADGRTLQSDAVDRMNVLTAQFDVLRIEVFPNVRNARGAGNGHDRWRSCQQPSERDLRDGRPVPGRNGLEDATDRLRTGGVGGGARHRK